MKITIRRLQATDEPFLWEALYQAIYLPAGSEPLPRSITQNPDLACYVEGWGRERDLGVIALDGDTPIGAAWVRLLHGYGFVEERFPELSISLIPAYRGQGLGSRLLGEAISLAQGSFPGISLSVSKGNPAKELYERSGFKVVSEDSQAYVMSLEFPDNC